MFEFVKTMYKMHKITASGVWKLADQGKITAEDAEKICGPRPKGE